LAEWSRRYRFESGHLSFIDHDIFSPLQGARRKMGAFVVQKKKEGEPDGKRKI
jgi:hypothetical protein